AAGACQSCKRHRLAGVEGESAFITPARRSDLAQRLQRIAPVDVGIGRRGVELERGVELLERLVRTRELEQAETQGGPAPDVARCEMHGALEQDLGFAQPGLLLQAES